MDVDVFGFFDEHPHGLGLFEVFEEKIFDMFPEATVRVKKTQISFYNKRAFAFVWLPIRRMKRRPEIYIVVSFSLPERIESPRIVAAVNPAPHRWTHHVLVQSEREINRELLGWIRQSYEYALHK